MVVARVSPQAAAHDWHFLFLVEIFLDTGKVEVSSGKTPLERWYPSAGNTGLTQPAPRQAAAA